MSDAEHPTSMAKHTPRPWTLDYPHIRFGERRADGSWPALAKVLTLPPRAEREANAALIAAAPTLAYALEQLVLALEWHRTEPGVTFPQFRVDDAKKALHLAGRPL